MRRGTAPLSSLEQIIQVLRQKRHKEISILGAGLPGIKERLAALGIKDSEYQVSGGYEYFPLNQFGGFIPNFSKLSVGDRRFIGYSRVSDAIKMLRSGQYADTIQDNDLLNIPKIQTEKLNVDSKDFRAASARRSKILTDLSQANKDVGKAFEAGIAKKYKSLKLTSEGGSIKFGSSSALDLTDDKTLVESKAGNYNFKNVEEKFFRFPFENINDSKYSGFLSQFTTKKDNIQLYQDKVLKLITAPESIDKEYLYRTADDARYQENLKALLSNKGFIPNFAFSGGRTHGLMNRSQMVANNLPKNSQRVSAWVGPNGTFFHPDPELIPDHGDLTNYYALSGQEINRSIRAYINSSDRTISFDKTLDELYHDDYKIYDDGDRAYLIEKVKQGIAKVGLKFKEPRKASPEFAQAKASIDKIKNASWDDFTEESTWAQIESLPLARFEMIKAFLEQKMDKRLGNFEAFKLDAQSNKTYWQDVENVKAGLNEILKEKMDQAEKAMASKAAEQKKLMAQYGMSTVGRGFSKGFIPNFASGYLGDVMSLESNLSNNTAVLDTTTGPYPFIRNTSQPNFAAAISDHGGEKKALKDSITNQTNAGLLSSRGMVPNFAPPPAPFQISGIQQGVGGTLITNAQKQALQTAVDTYIAGLTKPITNINDADQAFAALANNINTFITANGLDAASAKDIATQVQAYTRSLATQAQNLQTQNQLSITNKQNEYTIALEKLQSTLRRLNTDLLLSDDEINNLRREAKQLNQTLDTTAQEIQLSGGTVSGARPNVALDAQGNVTAGGRTRLQRLTRGVGNMSNNLALTFGAPLIAGQLQQAIVGNTERFEQSGAQRFANEAIGSGFTNIQTGAMIGAALTPILGPFGPLIGAAGGAAVTFTSALKGASDTLEDLQKSAQDLIQKNKADVDAAKNLIQLQQQLTQETDPYKIQELLYAIEDTTKGIENIKFADSIKSAGSNIKDLNEAISNFVKTSRQQEKLASSSVKAAKLEDVVGLDAGGVFDSFTLSFANLAQNFGFEKQIEKVRKNIFKQTGLIAGEQEYNKFLNLEFTFDYDANKKRLNEIFGDFTAPLIQLEDAINNIPQNDDLKKQFAQALDSITEFTTESDIRKKFQVFVDQGLIASETVYQIASVIDNQIEESIPGKLYLKNLKDQVGFARQSIQQAKKTADKNLASATNYRKVFADIALEVSRATFEIDTQIKKLDFSKEIGSLNLDKSFGLINQAFGAISKNIDDNLRPSIDKFVNDLNVAQQQAVLSLEASIFPQIQIQNLKKARQQNIGTISQFLEKESQPGQLDKINKVFDTLRSGNLDEVVNALKEINVKNGQNSEIARQEAIQKITQTQEQADLDSQLAKERFDTTQFWSNKQIELLKKIGEEEFKLSQIKLANAQKEKELIQSITFEGAKRQITGQGEIERKQLEMERPFRLLGRGEFGIQDENFRIQQEIFEKQQKLAIDQALNDAAIADVQRQVLESNTNATAENTKAIYESIARINLEKQSAATASIAETGGKIERRASLLETVNKDIKDFEDKRKQNIDTQISDKQKKLETQQSLLTQISKDEAAYLEQSRNAITYYNVPADSEIANTENRKKQAEKLQQDIEKTKAELSRLEKQKESSPQADKDYQQLQTQKTSLENQIDALKTEKSNQEANLESLKKAAEKLPTVSATSGVRNNLTQLPPGLNLNESLSYLQNQRSEQERILEGYQAQEIELKNRKAQGQDLSIDEENKLVSLRGQIINQQRVVNDLKLNELKTTEAIATNEERIKNNQLARAKRGKFLTGVQEGFQEIVTQSQNFEQNFGKTAVLAFRDGLTGAIDAAMNKTDDLGAALMEVASGFLRTIQGALNQQIANNLVMGIGSAFPSATGINAQSFARRRGGIIRAQNGIYVPSMAGGNGMGIQDRGRTGDVNPALLEDGEYVLNRNAVAALGGPSVLDSLNFGQFPRFANGGQNTGSLSANANFNEPFSQLSEFGKEQSPEYRNYLDRLRDQWEKDQAKKKQRRAFINQLIMTGVSAAFSAGLGAFARPAVSSQGTSSLNSMFSKGEVGFSYDNFVKPSPTSLSQLSYSDISAPRINDLSSSGISINPYRQKGGLMRFASGGYLPYGNRLNDTIPALLSGGEYIVNSRSVRKYGVGGMNRINSGVARFEDGGLVGDPGNQNNTPGNVESSNSNNVSINITVNNNGGSSSEQESSNGGLDAQDKDNQLGQRIKQAVLQVITDEQRTGGLLDSTKKK
jgi:hypothetical protein